MTNVCWNVRIENGVTWKKGTNPAYPNSLLVNIYKKKRYTLVDDGSGNCGPSNCDIPGLSTQKQSTCGRAGVISLNGNYMSDCFSDPGFLSRRLENFCSNTNYYGGLRNDAQTGSTVNMMQCKTEERKCFPTGVVPTTFKRSLFIPFLDAEEANEVDNIVTKCMCRTFRKKDNHFGDISNQQIDSTKIACWWTPAIANIINNSAFLGGTGTPPDPDQEPLGIGSWESILSHCARRDAQSITQVGGVPGDFNCWYPLLNRAQAQAREMFKDLFRRCLEDDMYCTPHSCDNVPEYPWD